MKTNLTKPYNLELDASSEPRLKLVTVEQLPYVVAESEPVRSARDAHRVLKAFLQRKDREYLVILHLDASHQPVSTEVVAIGTLNYAPVHMREIFKGAILANSAAIIYAHNHPSGSLVPSAEDRKACDRIRSAGELLGIPMLDFLVISFKGIWAASEHWI